MSFAKTKPPSDPTMPGDDLSPQIALVVERHPGEIVRCIRVGATHYRCNWWCASEAQEYDNPAMRGSQLGTTHRICRSQFLDAVLQDNQVRIRVISSQN